MATVTIDRATRDALRPEVRLLAPPLGDLDGTIGSGDGTESRNLRDQALLLFALLDDLDGRGTDSSRDTYTFTVDPTTLRDWLHEGAEDARAGAETERDVMRRQEAGDEDYFYIGRRDPSRPFTSSQSNGGSSARTTGATPRRSATAASWRRTFFRSSANAD